MSKNQQTSLIRGCTMPAARVAVSLALLLGSCGCSTQLVAVRVKNPDSTPLAGAPYNLTFTQWDITVTRRLSSCGQIDGNGNTTKAMVVSVKLERERKEERDPEREYVIDFSSLRSFFKTSSIEVAYHDNGTLKSVNAAAEDAAADTIAGVAQAVGKLAAVPDVPSEKKTDTGISLMQGRPLDPAEQERKKPASLCTDTVEALLKSIAGKESAVKQAKNKLEEVTVDLKRLTDMSAAMGQSWGRKERKELLLQIKLLYEARNELAKLDEELQADLEKVTYTDKVTWPASGQASADLRSAVPLIKPLTGDQIKKWVDPSDPERQKLAAETLAAETSLWVRLVATSRIGRADPCKNGQCRDEQIQGLKYRMPAPGALLLCRSERCDSARHADVLDADETLVSQLGPVLTLPLKNYPFMNQTISATFDKAGQPITLGYTEKAGAPKAANALGALSDQIAKVREARQPKSELEKIKEEVDLLKAKADLAAAKKALEPAKYADQTEAAEAFKADTTVLQAQLAKLQAQAALDAALAQAAKQL
jgi:hypothetical protein